MALEFVDTNIVIYAFAGEAKSAAAQAVLSRKCYISIQVLNEFANVARRKLSKSWPEIEHYLSWIEAVCGVVHPIDLETHRRGIELAAKYHFSVFDAMIVATALQAGATTLYSEDMQHGLLVEGRLRISNPFTSAT
ncbi:PIN domain-containing protein [Rhizobium sp. KVB221]|uniref:Ribonuclease VapC n=1 Tax=Rhizobium setariae TaxID=2801340 RepID=A0A937CNK7_9HYPH|nr:PIN domain-containing protein [Rhizobium setariae]MBL0372084.1 PIN domain-containing protein [Rhizobium setariae]